MPQHPLFTDDLREIAESFVAETREAFEAMEKDLLQLEAAPENTLLLDNIFRTVHTVKGTAVFLHLEQLCELTHHFEDVLNRLRSRDLSLQPEGMETMLRASDLMKILLQQVADEDVTPIEINEVIVELKAFSAGYRNSSHPAAIKRPKRSNPFASTAVARPCASRTYERGTPGMDTRPLQVGASQPDDFVYLIDDMACERDRFFQIVAKLPSTIGTATTQELADVTARIDAIITKLQATITRTRTVQIGRIFRTFHRLIRDLSTELGKEIELVIEGEETTFDKNLAGRIATFLVPVICNAADHGIELPEERAAAAKSTTGCVRLSAAQGNEHLVITIEDDGVGLDPEKLKHAAIDKMLVTPAEAAAMSDSNVYALIFHPGFSTATQVNLISGRGVGMDVVKTNVTRLKGTISIESTPGSGTRFIVRLPSTKSRFH